MLAKLPGGVLLVVGAVMLAGCGQSRQQDAASLPKPSPEFLALSPRDRNLAVYDAFFAQLESNYYDPAIFTSAQWQTRRAELRDKAAAAAAPVLLYNVLAEIGNVFPESHAALTYPQNPSPDKPVPPDPDFRRKAEHLWTLKTLGPGADVAEIRRGANKFLVVGDVWADTPAAEAGIRPGWRATEARVNLDFPADAVRFSGEFVPITADTTRALEHGNSADAIASDANVVHVKFDYRQIRWYKPLETRELDGGIRYVRFGEFGDGAAMKPVIDAINEAGPAGLILDLRRNSGGSEDEMKHLAATLLGGDTQLGSWRDRSGTTPIRSGTSRRIYTGPLAVLVGPLSASAAEVLAAAIQDHNRGILLGRTTLGAALRSKYFPLPDTGYVQVPIADYRRVSGGRIEGVGVEPDHWILPTLDEVRAGRDVVLERAIHELQSPRDRKSSSPGRS